MLTIKQFYDIESIIKDMEDPVERNLHLLAAVKGITIDDVENMPINKVKTELAKLNYLNLDMPDKIKHKFKIKGRTFKIVWKLEDIRANQYIDFKHFASQEQSIHKCMAVLCIELDWLRRSKGYQPQKHKELSEFFFKHMDISIAYPLMLFFCRYTEELMPIIKTYLRNEVEKMRSVNGDGFQ